MSRARNIADTGDNNLDDIVVDGSGNLDVTGTVTADGLTVQGSTGTVATFETTGTNGGGISLADANTTSNYVRIRGIGNEMNFVTNNTEAMRIDSNGGLRINKTSQLFNAASNEKLTVDGATDGHAASFSTSATGGFPAMYVQNTQSGSVSGIIFMQGSPSGIVGSIGFTGGTTTSYNTTSDYRLKENVTDISDATTRLKQLNPVRFNFIADADTTVDGFLAHEVQDIVPEAITGTKDAMRDEEYEVTPAVLDDDGNVVTEAVMGTRSVPDYQGIDQSKLVPLLVKTIQELEARIAALENA